MDYPSVLAIVLAAGKGTRMKSDLPKVLHELFFAPMLNHVLDTLSELSLKRTIVVTGHHAELVEESLAKYQLIFVRQEEQLGTGHAVNACAEHFRHHKGPVLILCGDTPLISPGTIGKLLQTHLSRKSSITVMTALLDDPTGYGRVVVANDGSISRVVEEKDASLDEKRITEVNAGIYCVDASVLPVMLKKIKNNNRQGEFYLTDIVEHGIHDGLAVGKFLCANPEEVMGVNTRHELARAHGLMQQRYLRALMDIGVSVLSPETVTVSKEVTIGKDSIIYPNVSITGLSRIGSGVYIDSFVRIHDSKIGDGVKIQSFVNLFEAVVAPGSVLSPVPRDLLV